MLHCIESHCVTENFIAFSFQVVDRGGCLEEVYGRVSWPAALRTFHLLNDPQCF